MRLSPRRTAVVLTTTALALGGLLVAPTHARAESPTDPGLGDESALAEALKRDLGISLEQFRAAGALGEQAAQIQAELGNQPGLQRFAVQDGKLVVIGTGAEVEAAAAKHGAKVNATAATATATPVADMVNRYLDEVGPAGLQYIGVDASGYVIKVNEPAKALPSAVDSKGKPKKSATDFARQFKNVKVVQSKDKMQKTAATVYDGQGIQSLNTVCSLGFAAWNSAGAPYGVTAGHCSTGTGQTVSARDFNGEPALGGSGYAALTGTIGTYQWAEFGSTSETAPGTDLATIASNGSMYMAPLVTKWQASAGTPTDNPVAVTGQAAPVIGNPVCRSGRTTGWQCSTITYLGAAAVDAGNNVIKFVDGFASDNLRAAPGDSGGSMISGYKAVGVTSATGTNGDGTPITTGAAIVDLAKRQPGMTIKTAIYAPHIVGASPTGTNTYVTSAQAGPMQVRVPVPAGDTLAPNTVLTVKVDGVLLGTYTMAADGTVSFNYPAAPGSHTVTLTVTNGFNSSETTSTVVRSVTGPSGALGDQDGDGLADMFSIANDGTLNYIRTASPGVLAEPVPVGKGWDAFRWVSNLKDMNGDGWSEVLVITYDGRLGFYLGNGPGRLQPVSWVGYGWQDLDQFVIVDDVDGDGRQEIVARRTFDGAMVRYPISAGVPLSTSGQQVVAKGWGSVNQVFTVGDFSGDATPDVLVTVDGGALWRNCFNPNKSGTISCSEKIGSGWSVFKSIASPGDSTGDGRRDAVALTSDGTVVFYTNNYPGLTPKVAASGWTNIRMIY